MSFIQFYGQKRGRRWSWPERGLETRPGPSIKTMVDLSRAYYKFEILLLIVPFLLCTRATLTHPLGPVVIDLSFLYLPPNVACPCPGEASDFACTGYL
jgi:hypothetical protein